MSAQSRVSDVRQNWVRLPVNVTKYPPVRLLVNIKNKTDGINIKYS